MEIKLFKDEIQINNNVANFSKIENHSHPFKLLGNKISRNSSYSKDQDKNDNIKSYIPNSNYHCENISNIHDITQIKSPFLGKINCYNQGLTEKDNNIEHKIKELFGDKFPKNLKDSMKSLDSELIENGGNSRDVGNLLDDFLQHKCFEFKDCKHDHFYFKPQTILDGGKVTDYDEFDLKEIKKENYAKKFSFPLDMFQQRAIMSLENNESVLVTAHTSSGKTVVAEYAIAMALRDNKKVIFTSPIKALSNQKYRDFKLEFQDVGLMTGDVTKNPLANCLIMTTEILRNALYEKSNLLKDVAWIIFDEIHYMKDKIRGVVWEETIIMLPNTIKCVFLSATIPNAAELASWICFLKQAPLNIIGTEKRAVPIAHYAYCNFLDQGDSMSNTFCFNNISNNYNLLNLLDLSGNFNNNNWSLIKSAISAQKPNITSSNFLSSSLSFRNNIEKNITNYNYNSYPKHNNINYSFNSFKNSGNSYYLGTNNMQRSVSYNNQGNNNFCKYTKQDFISKRTKEKSADIRSLANKLHTIGKTPALFFCFYKRECDEFANELLLSDFTNSAEKRKIKEIYTKAFSTLDSGDFDLQQVKNMISLITNGIAYHHSGLLPIVKECVELLFQSGLIKILLSTETLAMGVNMPAKTVVFTRIQKYDGKLRCLNSSEYIQMCGRAGRRGKDSEGLCIMMLEKNNKEDLENYYTLLNSAKAGKSEHLYSTFRMRFSQLLTVMKTEKFKYEKIGKQSFFQFQANQGIPLKIKELKENYIKYKQLQTPLTCLNNNTEGNETQDLVSFADLADLKCQRDQLQNKIYIEIFTNEKIKIVKAFAEIFEPGILIKFKNRSWGVFISLSFYIPSTSKKMKKISNYDDIKNLLIREKNYDNVDIKEVICEIFLYNGNIPLAEAVIIEDLFDYFDIHTIPLTDLENISKWKIEIPKNSNGKNFIKTCAKKFHKLSKSIGKENNFDVLNLIKDFSIKSDLIDSYSSNLESVIAQLRKKELAYDHIQKKTATIEAQKCKLADNLLSNFEQLKTFQEFKLKGDLEKMERILVKMNYINNNDITDKGKAASVISAANELLLTEMLFKGEFDNIQPNYLAAMFSCFVIDAGRFTKDDSYLRYPEISNTHLTELLKRIELAKINLTNFLNEIGFISEEIDIKGHFMSSILEWADGKSFFEVCNKTKIYEGNLISCIKRLDELLSQLQESCSLIKYDDLKRKFEKASSLIRRGIVITESLWLE